MTEFYPFTLEEKLRGKISFPQILKYSLQIVDCFLFLYKHGIVHRDVKLENLFVSEDDRIMLGGFGESVETNENHCCLLKNLRAGNQLFTAPEVMNSLSKEKVWINFSKQYSWDVVV